MLWTALTLGLVSSLHCVGMCGPIALAMPLPARTRWMLAGNSLLYQSGRVVTYASLGLLFGLLGQVVTLAGWQKGLSIALGMGLLLTAVFSWSLERYWAATPFVTGLKKRMGKLLQRKGHLASFGVGLLNGLLPCGMVYMALAGALAVGTPVTGAAYMALFGIGTIPLMLALTIAGRSLTFHWRKRLQKAVPVVLVAFAVLLILRGFQVPLPLDLHLWQSGQEIPMCH